MKGKYETVYESSYGIVTAYFKDEMTYEEAIKLGKEYCENNGFKYIKTAMVDA